MEKRRNKLSRADIKRACDFLKGRAHDFEEEGYRFVIRWSSTQLVLYKMRHESNGNEIIIKGYPDRNLWGQYMNNKPTIQGRRILNV